MKRSIALAITAVWLLNGQPAWAQKDEAKEHAELAKALSAAKVSLQTGLCAARWPGSRDRRVHGKHQLAECRAPS